MKEQDKYYAKPYYHEGLGYYVCGNPYCESGINQYNKHGKCPDCGVIRDWGVDD